MAINDQIYKCGPNVRHFFREMRAKNKQPGPPFYIWNRCTRCTAMLLQVVAVKIKKDPNTGDVTDVVPTQKAYLISASHKVEVEALVQEVEPIKYDETIDSQPAPGEAEEP